MNPGRRRRVSYTAAAAVPLAVLSVTIVIPLSASAASTHGRAAVAWSHPGWATPARRTAVVPATKPVRARVYLAPRDPSALAAAVTAVSTPGSPTYHHFVSPAQYTARYAATATQVAAVATWLRASGLRVASVAAGNRYLAFTGTAAEAQHAFGTQLGLYRHDGSRRLAPASPLTVPSRLASAVLGVTGLTDDTARVTPDIHQPRAYRNPRPCSRYYGQLTAGYRANFRTRLPAFRGRTRDYAVCGYTPKQLRGAYGVKATGLNGSGVTVAVIDAYQSPTLRSDANTYAVDHGGRVFAAGRFQTSAEKPFTHKSSCGAAGWSGEQTLDVEAVHSMAPAARVLYYGAASCYDAATNDALAQVIQDNKASIVTNSYGDEGERARTTDVEEFHSLAEQAAMQGISVDFSSGDDGDEVAGHGVRSADFPGTDPDVTAVGGTAVAISRTNAMEFATGWGTDMARLSRSGKSWSTPSFLYGAGGGFSTLFNRPAYQKGVVPADNSGGRAVPDIAMDADPTTGMLVGETQKFPNGKDRYAEYRIGGTSLASPLFAGDEADAVQHAGGGRLGLVNPQLYALARRSHPPYYDVARHHTGVANVRVDYANSFRASGGLRYTVRTFGTDSSLATRKGWDDVTGVGQPTEAFLRSLTTSTSH